MANFNTHLIVSAAASGAAATSLLGAGVSKPQDAAIYFSLGTIGGLLPDLDSDNSAILKSFFNILGIILAFSILFTQVGKFSIAELFILWVAVYSLVHYGASALFTRLTTHRGIFHSIPAALFFWMAVTLLSTQFLNFAPVQAWLAGFFIFLGYLIHLILDEIFSVDLANQKIKRSFGSAFKLFDTRNIPGTIILYLLVAFGLFLAPDYKVFLALFKNKTLLTSLKSNLFPSGKWFIK